jgi:formamidopyrimidine-DNA glycosylase
MPELPEVEVCRIGLLPLVGRRVESCVMRRAGLRLPFPPDLPALLEGRRLSGIGRRGKYLLFSFPEAEGTLVLHLGMSGSLRLLPPGTPPKKHDHLDLLFDGAGNALLRFADPRRFGLAIWQPGTAEEAAKTQPLLAALGIEPFSDEFSGAWLYARTRGKAQAIKPLLMDSHWLVGVGNIYASESLFRAGISPFAEAGSLSRPRLERLAGAIVATLEAAIAAGGSSIRDYAHSDGGLGSFQLQCAAYGREGLPCPKCGRPIQMARQAGRATFYCGHCQRR